MYARAIIRTFFLQALCEIGTEHSSGRERIRATTVSPVHVVGVTWSTVHIHVNLLAQCYVMHVYMYEKTGVYYFLLPS